MLDPRENLPHDFAQQTLLDNHSQFQDTKNSTENKKVFKRYHQLILIKSYSEKNTFESLITYSLMI